jgi:tetratricopeptide (TPR) repeat protein
MRHAAWPSLILSLPIAVALFPQALFPQAAFALSFDRLNEIAQDITVRLDAERPGSGVMIRRQGNEYTVLTAKHLVAVQDNYAVVTPDGQRHPIVAKNIQAIPDTDLAIVQFQSKRRYPVADLASYTPSSDQYLFLSGFPAPSESGVSEQIRLFIPGQAVSLAQAMTVAAEPLSQGYRLFYNNIADPGMSGGAILDSDGRLIGVHGRSDGEDVADTESGQRRRLRLGISAGLPIKWLLRLRPDLKLMAQNNMASPPSDQEMRAFEQSMKELALTPSGELTAVAWANYANLLYRTRQFAESLRAINKSLETKFDFPQFWYAQGLILLEMRQYQDALNAFDRSIKLNPRFYRAWKSKAMALFAMNRPQDALAATDTALKLEGQSAVILFLRGNIFSQKLQDFGAALESFDQAIALEPDFPAAWMERGRALQQLNRSAEALASVNQALSIDPNDRDARALHDVLAGQLRSVQK